MEEIQLSGEFNLQMPYVKFVETDTEAKNMFAAQDTSRFWFNPSKKEVVVCRSGVMLRADDVQQFGVYADSERSYGILNNVFRPVQGQSPRRKIVQREKGILEKTKDIMLTEVNVSDLFS